MNHLYTSYFAQANLGYGCQAYGQTDAYNSCTVTAAPAASGLANTGSPVALAMSIALLVIVAVIIVQIWPKRKKAE